MVIYLGTDHRGFELKERLKESLKADGYDVVDVGAEKMVPDDDYTDYAAAVAEKVAMAPELGRGIVLCGSGFGVDITANKVNGIRAGLAMNPDHAYQGRHDDDINVLALAADFVDEVTAKKIVKIFLSTPFAKEEKYSRRIAKIGKIENMN